MTTTEANTQELRELWGDEALRQDRSARCCLLVALVLGWAGILTGVGAQLARQPVVPAVGYTLTFGVAVPLGFVQLVFLRRFGLALLRHCGLPRAAVVRLPRRPTLANPQTFGVWLAAERARAGLPPAAH